MNATELNALADRVEKATGPDYALDSDIAEALTGPPFSGRSYTASLDAAMTLVPEGWDWSVGTETLDGFPPGQGNVWPKSQPFPVELDIFAEAPTPALALTAACLRAHAASLAEVPA